MPKLKKTIDPERGRRLKKCLIAAGVSVPSFAASLGMAEGSVRNIISGQRSLTDNIAIQAADLLGVRAAYLLNLDDFQTEGAITWAELKDRMVDKFKSRLAAGYTPTWNDAMKVVEDLRLNRSENNGRD